MNGVDDVEDEEEDGAVDLLDDCKTMITERMCWYWFQCWRMKRMKGW